MNEHKYVCVCRKREMWYVKGVRMNFYTPFARAHAYFCLFRFLCIAFLFISLISLLLSVTLTFISLRFTTYDSIFIVHNSLLSSVVGRCMQVGCYSEIISDIKDIRHVFISKWIFIWYSSKILSLYSATKTKTHP